MVNNKYKHYQTFWTTKWRHWMVTWLVSRSIDLISMYNMHWVTWRRTSAGHRIISWLIHTNINGPYSWWVWVTWRTTNRALDDPAKIESRLIFPIPRRITCPSSVVTCLKKFQTRLVVWCSRERSQKTVSNLRRLW